MDANSYFDYMGILRLNESELALDTLITYLHGRFIGEEETLKARSQILHLESMGLLTVRGDGDRRSQTVALTKAGEAIADMIAYLRSDSMLRQYVVTV